MESTLTDRLKELASQLHLSQSQFADALSVQRSTISHLFSGRNKPSIALIVKISETFPELNMPWLLHGQGAKFSKNTSPDKEQSPLVTGVNYQEAKPIGKNQSATETENSSTDQNKPETPTGFQANEAPKLTKIALIYSDGSVQLIDAN